MSVANTGHHFSSIRYDLIRTGYSLHMIKLFSTHPLTALKFCGTILDMNNVDNNVFEHIYVTPQEKKEHFCSHSVAFT